jgi:hypothetical protein
MRPAMAFVHLTSTSPNFNFERFLRLVDQRTHQIPVVISGYPTRTYHKEIPPTVQFKKSFEEVIELINSL